MGSYSEGHLYYKAGREGAWTGWLPVVGYDGRHVAAAPTWQGLRKQWEYWTHALTGKKHRMYARGHLVYPHSIIIAIGAGDHVLSVPTRGHRA